MKQLLFFLFALAICLLSCQAPVENTQANKDFEESSAPTTAESLKQKATGTDARRKKVNVRELTGRWKTNLVDVRMTSVKGIADSTAYISARAETFVDDIGIQQMEYWFRKNGAYNIIYRDRSDIIVRTFSGNWKLEGETLVLDEVSPKRKTFYYEFTAPFEEDYQARLRGVLDYDYDGEDDDKVIMVLEKVSQ